MACALFVTALTSFSKTDPCKPTYEEFNASCEISSNTTCNIYIIGGACDGAIYTFPFYRTSQN